MSNQAIDLSPGDIIDIWGQKVGLIIHVHENEYGVFYNIMVDGELHTVSSQELILANEVANDTTDA